MHEQILTKLIRYEIAIRKAVNGQMDGKFKSIFKGTGLEFSDLRTYAYGDDLRLIDWNASSKGQGVFVKLFREEKEQQIFLMLDVSDSQKVGKQQATKEDLAKQICGTMALAGINEASKVGLYCFSDQKELFVAPQQGKKFGYRLINQLFDLKPASSKTKLSNALLFGLQILKKRSVVILISDFIDQQYSHNLRALARKHDLIVLHIYDQRETALPRLGTIPVLNLETNAITWANTSWAKFRQQISSTFKDNQVLLEQICKQNKADYLALNPQEDFVPQLVRLFKARKLK
jgi:uncharacterized protein (DUF58 family)